MSATQTAPAVKPSTQAANLLKHAGVLNAQGPAKVKVGKNPNPAGTVAWERFRVVAQQARIDARSEWIGAKDDAIASVRLLVTEHAPASARWSLTAGGVTRSLVSVLEAMEGSSLQASAAFAFAATLEIADVD